MVYLLQQVALSCTLCQSINQTAPFSRVQIWFVGLSGQYVPRFYKNNDAINCHGLKSPISAKRLLLKLE
jgi:hypothetical protein